jgi:hypothetical protein
MSGLNHKVKHKQNVIVTELENKDAVLLNLTTKKYYTLNETGLRIWQLAGQGLKLKEISVKIQEEYAVSSEKADESVLKVMDQLVEENLIKVENA